MDLKGQYIISAKKDKVWDHLNNPETLKNSIKGCQNLNKITDTEFIAKVKAKIGPVSAIFSGSVKLSDLDPPNSYVITGQGKGGAAGFAKGSIKIKLSDNEKPNHTSLNYEGNAQIGGKLAQLGSRLIGGVIQNTTDDFFQKFNDYVISLEHPEEITNKPQTSTSIKETNLKIPYWIWISSLIIIMGLILAYFT